MDFVVSRGTSFPKRCLRATRGLPDNGDWLLLEESLR
jgi:hypothetical protein